MSTLERHAPGAPEETWWRRVTHRLASSETLDATETERAAIESGCDRIRECPRRRRVDLFGIVTSVTTFPKSAAGVFEAELWDGTGTITLHWMGRRDIRGVLAGCRMRVSGVLAREGGRPIMFNPAYQLLPARRG